MEPTNPTGSSNYIESLPGNPFEFCPTGFAGVNDLDLLSSQILIFDNQDCGKPIRSYLLEAGFTSVSITNQTGVLTAIINDRATDLVIFDCESLNTPELGEAIADCNSRNNIPVLAIADRDDLDGKQLAAQFGVDDFLSKPIDGFELVARTRNTLRSRIATNQLALYSAQLKTDILIDPLTGISNRRAFDFELSRKMIEWQRQRSPIALLMIDIDYFKQVNDVYGHQAGDHVLSQVANEISETLREMDLVCRYGGEEFAVILPIKKPQESTQTAERIRQKIESKAFRFEDFELQVTVSIGIAEAMKGDDQELIVKRADTALYDSKRNGRNLVTFHDGARCVSIQRSGSNSEAPNLRTRNENLLSWAVNDDVFNLCSSNILIVDDSWSTTRVVRTFLDKGGFRNLLCETDSTKVMDYIQNDPPDLLLMDIRMPNIDGLTILKQIRNEERLKDIPVIILTSNTETETRSKAIEQGANDFLLKPVIGVELIARVTNTLLANAHTRFLAGYSTKLEQEIKLRTSELIASRREAIQCLARAAEIRNDSSGRHILRVGKYAAIIADELGFTDSQVIEMEHAAQLHDVGKIGVPESILTKQERLTDEEFDIVKDHCFTGGKIIRDDGEIVESAEEKPNLFLLDSCSSSVMRMAALVAESHHEKWDGTGYPHGLRGGNIPIEGRIAAVCDVFDAVSNPNAYRQAHDLESCFQIIAEGKGTHFDPEVVEAFFRRKNEAIQVFRDFGNIIPVLAE